MCIRRGPKARTSPNLGTRIAAKSAKTLLSKEQLWGLSLEEALKFYREVWNAGWDEIGALAKLDRYFLLTHVCNRQDAIDPWLYDRCREVERNPEDHLDLWAREHYKGQPLDTPTKTPDGWRLFGDLVPGDEIFGPDGRPCRIVARTEIFQDPECYEVEFDDGEKLTVSSNHLWSVERRTRKRIPMAYNKLGPKRQYRETAVLATTEIAAHDHQADNRLAVPVNDPLDLPDADLPIDPYTLGLWLGDGFSTAGRIGCADTEVFDHVEAAGEKLGIVGHQGSMMLRTVLGMTARLRGLGICGKDMKAIPAPYLHASAAQRLALLQGLMDTDGHCNTRGTATFCNTNDDLVDGFCELANTLGLKPRRRRHTGKHNGEPYPFWQVSFQAYKEFPPFRLKRKLARCKDGERKHPRRYIVACRKVPSVPMRCIQVDREDGMYLAGRSMVPTHNSTIITFAGAVQEILRNPDITIGIFSFNNNTANKFLKQIKRELEDNRVLKTCFPEVLWEHPHKQAVSWSEQNGIIVRRKSNPKEATVEAHGLVDGMPTGAHYKLRIYDDVITEDYARSPEMIEKATNAWRLSQNLGARGGKRWHVGTRYHFNDTYRFILDEEILTPRVHPATEDGTPTGKPVFLTEKELSDKRRDQGPYIFACQQLQNPVADDIQGFKREWLHHYNVEGTTNKYLLCDPANEKKKTSDYTVFMVVGLGLDNNYYIHDMVRDRLNLSERANMLFFLHRKWKPLGVGYEKYGKDSDIQHFEDKMARETYRFHITPLGGPMKKEDRIRRLVPLFEQGRIYLPEVLYKDDYEGKRHDLVHDFVEQEYMGFPVATHDDMLDCLARIRDPDFHTLWPQGDEVEVHKPERYTKRPTTNRSWMAA